MDQHVTYWGDLADDAVNRSRDLASSLPFWELALAVVGTLAGTVIASFGIFFIFRFTARQIQRASPKFRRCIWIGATIFVIYLGLYIGTTEVRPQGYGGLKGPLRVRVFQNETHLVAFYPLYLVERWIRNGSFTVAVYYFNLEFKDGRYPHSWLYNDGVYGRIWYDF